MKSLILIFILSSFAFSQGAYLSDESGLSSSFLYGKYETNKKYGINAIYSIKGVVDFSLARQSVLNDEDITNYENEYLLRMYIRKEKPLFFSGGFGYLFQKAEVEVFNVLITETNKNFVFEGGLHSVLKDTQTQRITISIFYRHLLQNEETQIAEKISTNTSNAFSLIFDSAVTFKLGWTSLFIGPKVILDHYNEEYLFYGLKAGIIFKH